MINDRWSPWLTSSQESAQLFNYLTPEECNTIRKKKNKIIFSCLLHTVFPQSLILRIKKIFIYQDHYVFFYYSVLFCYSFPELTCSTFLACTCCFSLPPLSIYLQSWPELSNFNHDVSLKSLQRPKASFKPLSLLTEQGRHPKCLELH